jgi:hypothetical protein
VNFLYGVVEGMVARSIAPKTYRKETDGSLGSASYHTLSRLPATHKRYSVA